MNDWIHKMISTHTRESSEACADENMIACYLEGTLSPREKIAFEAHASECGHCQEVLALVMKVQEEEQKALVLENNDFKFSRKPWFHFSFPVPVLGGVLVVLLSFTAIFLFMRDSGDNLHPAQSAQLHLPVPETEPLKQKVQEVSSAKNAGTPHLQNPPVVVPRERNETPIAPAFELKNSTAPSKVLSDQMAPVQPEPPAPMGKAEVLSQTGQASLDAPAVPLKRSQADSRQFAIQAERAEGGNMKGIEKPKERATRKIGDKDFYWDSGYWTDRECLNHPGVSVIEIAPTDEEYKSILDHYPDLLELMPAKIFSGGRIYILR